MGRRLTAVIAVALWLGTPGAGDAQGGTAAPAPVRELRIDPLLLGSVAEYRNIIRRIGPDLFPGWRANDMPILLYRPGVQDILIGAPHRPPGYTRYTGPSPLPGETIYARNDSTLMTFDDQNTSTDLDGMRVLVVADPWSRMRNQLRSVFGRPAAFVDPWLDAWNFIPSPYDEIQLLLHEAFHVHQDRLAPDKGANEAAVAQYPVLDPANNALFALEGLLLRDATLARDTAARRERAGMFLAVRHARRAALDTALVAYENLNEYSEGLGRYVEYRFMQVGERVTPTPGMWQHAGFRGYGDELSRRFASRMEDMVRVAGNTDDRFGNKFGTGPLRFRLYDLGAAQGILLDALAPGWKARIFAPGVYLTDLLSGTLALSPAAERDLLDRAKQAYDYPRLLAEREAFAEEGRARIRQRVDSILGTTQTLITIDYSATGERLGMAYTPFGVTAVTDKSAIYDLVPISIRFENGVLLRLKSVVPVLVDRRAHTVQFAIPTPAASIAGTGASGIELPEFSLAAGETTSVAVSGDKVLITLH